jgi:hypothetical protein
MLREAGFRERLRRGRLHIYQRLTNQPAHATRTPFPRTTASSGVRRANGGRSSAPSV